MSVVYWCCSVAVHQTRCHSTALLGMFEPSARERLQTNDVILGTPTPDVSFSTQTNMDDLFTGLVRHDYDRMRMEADDDQRRPSTPHQVETDGGDANPDPTQADHVTSSDSSPPTPPSSSHSSLDKPGTHSVHSTTSTSSTNSVGSDAPSSLEIFKSPRIDYDRDNDDQRLVAVIGREFDEPTKISLELQKITPNQQFLNKPVIKFVPFTVARGILRKCKFDWRELRQYDLVCLCYNSSEARILLTGVDGFYSTLLANLEGIMGKLATLSGMKL